MTPAAAASIVRHLATEIMGWTEHYASGYWVLADGRYKNPRNWNPLTDANAMLECVCAAQGCTELTITRMRDDEGIRAEHYHPSECVPILIHGVPTPASICEAVCLAIGRATGWHEPEEVDNANA